jgi:ribose transport system substrate-binding protein
MRGKRLNVSLISVLTVLALIAACGGDDAGGDATTAADEATTTTAAAGDTTTTAAAGDTTTTAAGEVPDWCGPDEIVLGMTDGFGGNSWRLVTTASARDEAAKCPSVTEFVYADGQGDTQKAISDIQGMVATGVDALVVFPDASEAVLPALRSAFEAGVVTVPYRVFPGGEDGADYTKYVALDSVNDGHTWANWILEILPEGGTVLMLSGPPGNSQGVLEAEGLHEILEPTGLYTFIGEQPFEPTGWDPAVTQQVLTAAIASNPEIDVIVSDFGPSLVGALPEFENSGRSIPPIATSDGNLLGCFWQEKSPDNPDFQLLTIQTGNDHSRLAIQWAVALATGGVTPAASEHQHLVFENSVTGDPNPVQCEPDLPGDVYLSAEMSGEDQAALMD